MKGGSFVACPPTQSTRSLAVGSWRGKLDRQMSLDRSVVGISGSFSQVPFANAVSNAPWTPGPPRSPRQSTRAHSPMRRPPAPQPAVVLERVLAREPHEDGSSEIFPERLTHKKVRSLDATAPVPFFAMPSQQASKRSSSPRNRTCSPTPLRRPSVIVFTKDSEEHNKHAPRITSSKQLGSQAPPATSTMPNASPRCPEAHSSPLRWTGPWAAAQPARVLEIDEMNLKTASLKQAMPGEDPRASLGMSASQLARSIDEHIEAAQGQTAFRARAPDARARTLSPARMHEEGPARISRVRGMPNVSLEVPGAVPGGQRIARLSAPPVFVAKDELEILRRPQAAPAPAAAPKEEVLEPAEQGVHPSALELKPWLEAAENFSLNTDFELGDVGNIDFGTLMALMKKESAGKWTIQTMADKLLLNGLLENLGLPHMPMIFASRSLLKLRERLEVLVDKLIIATEKKQPYDIIVKPTHLSSAQGVMSFNKVHAPHREECIRQLEKHMRKFLETSANKLESLALQSLKPGFIGQPKYKSVVGFKAPLELKVCALWGKARCGVWWWGTRMAGPAQIPHRNVWVVRDPLVPGELSDNDGWEVLHNHPGRNPGFEQAVNVFKRHMPEMAALTETLATALGTPFLRCDFFVGSAKWGVRLNEVAYGCGLEYRNLLKECDSRRVIDDKPGMSDILRQGMPLCHKRFPPQHFLGMLGVQGTTYEDTAVVPLSCPLTDFATTMNAQSDPDLRHFTVEEDDCQSVKELPQKENTHHRAIEIPMNVMHKAHMMKPHMAHIPTLMMPGAKVITNNPHVLHQSATLLKAPVPGGGYMQAQHVRPQAFMQPMMRGPMR